MGPDARLFWKIVLAGGPIAWVTGASIGLATHVDPLPVVSEEPASTVIVTSVPEPLIAVDSVEITVTAPPETVTLSPEPVPPDKGGPLPAEMTESPVTQLPPKTSTVTLTPTAIPSSSDAGKTSTQGGESSSSETPKDTTTSAATESDTVQLGIDSGGEDSSPSTTDGDNAVHSSAPSSDARCAPGKRSDGRECDPDSGSDHPSSSGR